MERNRFFDRPDDTLARVDQELTMIEDAEHYLEGTTRKGPLHGVYIVVIYLILLAAILLAGWTIVTLVLYANSTVQFALGATAFGLVLAGILVAVARHHYHSASDSAEPAV